jgi:PAS domain-containing protein
MELRNLEGPPEAHDVERVAYLFRQVPPMIGASLIGIFLVFVFLFEAVGAVALKAWAAYMLSVLGIGVWLWSMHRNAAVTPLTARRWEYAAVVGALLMGIGWGSLGGLLYPAGNHAASDFVALMMLAVAFSAVTFMSMSLLCFFAITLPAMVPIGMHVLQESPDWLSGPHLAMVVLFGVLLTLQRSQFVIIMDNLRRRVQSEILLSEQQAIFQSTSQGIALVSGGHIVKCNQRLGEILSRRLQDLYALGFAEHFVDRAEFERTVAASTEAFSRNRNYLGMVRLRRADGSEFQAELSGRRMHGADDGRSVWLIGDVTPAQATSQPRR